MRIVMLIENTAATSRLAVQHGLSMFIEGERESYLFGLGGDSKLLSNAARLKLSVKSVQKAVISHNHPAHTGGAEALLNENPRLMIYAKESACRHQVKKNGTVLRSRDSLVRLAENYPDNTVLFRNFQEVGKDFYLMSNEVFDREFYNIEKSNRIMENGEIKPFDPSSECFGVLFPYERKEDGCVIIAGCCHCGAPNIIRTVKNTWQDVPVIAFIGGLHLMGSNTKKLSVSGEYIERLAKEFRELAVGTVYVCHCVGLKGYEELKRLMGERVRYLQTGEEIDF